MGTPATAAQGRRTQSADTGVWVDRIAGSYRRITAHQLAMAWWLYRERHITKRQLRVWFAAHEMAERRRYTKATDGDGKSKRWPSYGLDELRALVGGRGSKSAQAELSADLKALASIGLVSICERTIEFAECIERLTLNNFVGFQEMLAMLPHKRRAVPVPRRVLRALSGGLTTGMTAVVLAALIRSMFWHRGRGAYRVDGRTKRDWIVKAFGVSHRSVTEARARLIALGWLVPIDTPQWMLNRHGAHDRINTDWSAGERSGREQANDNAGGLASPEGQSPGGSASPDQNRFPSSSRNRETRSSAPSRAGPSGASLHAGGRGVGRSPKRLSRGEPSLRDVRWDDLADIDRLLKLYGQAVDRGLADDCEAGRLEFVAMAERARRRGRRAGALFYWLVRERKREFITHTDEEEAARRLRECREGKGEHRVSTAAKEVCSRPPQDEDHTVVRICVHVARQHKIDDPYHVARRYKGWTREQWERAWQSHEEARWRHASNIAANCAE